MKLKDFDFRIWDTEDKLYLEQRYTKMFNCFEAVDYAVGLVGNRQIKTVYEIITGVDSTQDALDDYKWINNLGENRFEIEPWTGFYDRKWSKIYEGDIVCKEGESIGFVKYHQGMFKVVEKEDFMIPLGGMFMRKHIEVIGNIHENADLLVIKE